MDKTGAAACRNNTIRLSIRVEECRQTFSTKMADGNNTPVTIRSVAGVSIMDVAPPGLPDPGCIKSPFRKAQQGIGAMTAFEIEMEIQDLESQLSEAREALSKFENEWDSAADAYGDSLIPESCGGAGPDQARADRAWNQMTNLVPTLRKYEELIGKLQEEIAELYEQLPEIFEEEPVED